MTHATVSLVSFILFLSYTAVTVTSTTLHPVPVLLWSPSGDSSVSSPSALGSLSSDKFSDLIQNELDKNPFTVLFVEETLSVEDLSLKGNSGLNPYEGIRKSLKDGRATYLPAVNGPIHVINQLFKDSPVSRVSLTEHGLKTDVTPEEEPRLLVVRLRDANEGEPRLHFLARHDVFITNMLEKLTEKHGKDGVLAIYTGRMPSWSLPEPEKNSHFRLKRAAGDEAGNTTIKDFYNLDQV